MTAAHEGKLRMLSTVNLAAQARSVTRAVKRLKTQAAAVDKAAGADSFAAVAAAFDAARDQIREVQMVGLGEDPQVKADFDLLMGKAQALGTTMAAMGSWAEEDPDWSGDVAAEWEAANQDAGRTDPGGLTALPKAAKQAVAVNNPGSPPIRKAMHDAIDDIDKQFGGLEAGPAMYLRQLKSGAQLTLKT